MPNLMLAARWLSLPALCVVAGLAAATAGSSGADPSLPDSVLAGCASCHGPGGNSRSQNVPRLNGQRQDYLLQRLKAFRDPTRQAPHATYLMWDVSTRVADARMAALSSYYAAQAPTPALGSGPRAAEGDRLFHQGAEGVQACQGCHGARGEGNGAMPRVAGQHAAYLSQALVDFNVQTRVPDSMLHPALHLTNTQIEALVAYLAND